MLPNRLYLVYLDFFAGLLMYIAFVLGGGRCWLLIS